MGWENWDYWCSCRPNSGNLDWLEVPKEERWQSSGTIFGIQVLLWNIYNIAKCFNYSVLQLNLAHLKNNFGAKLPRFFKMSQVFKITSISRSPKFLYDFLSPKRWFHSVPWDLEILELAGPKSRTLVTVVVVTNGPPIGPCCLGSKREPTPPFWQWDNQTNFEHVKKFLRAYRSLLVDIALTSSQRKQRENSQSQQRHLVMGNLILGTRKYLVCQTAWCFRLLRNPGFI